MKKIKLDAGKLQLKKEKIASLTNEQMGQVIGGQEVTTATFATCCLPTQQQCATSLRLTCVNYTQGAGGTGTNCGVDTTTWDGATCENVCPSMIGCES